ncbi:MAG: PaaI family thioesterase [Syntrophobacteraceae bacterium]
MSAIGKGNSFTDMQQKNKPSSFTGPHQFKMKEWISCAPFESLLNMSILEASDGKAILTMPFLIDYAQGAGLMHGGALVSLADTAVVMAIKSLLPPLSHFATIDLSAKYLAPVKQGAVTAKAVVVSKEGRILKGQATLYDEEGRAVMEFSSTFKIAKDMQIRGITFEGIVG